jgi:hypothetical protein
LRDAIVAKFPAARADLRKNVDLRSLKFHDVESGALPYIGFELGCSWDDEHGLGVLMHGTRVVKIGQADTALLEWIPEGDAKKQKRLAPTSGAKRKPAPKKNGAAKKKPAPKKNGAAKKKGAREEEARRKS